MIDPMQGMFIRLPLLGREGWIYMPLDREATEAQKVHHSVQIPELLQSFEPGLPEHKLSHSPTLRQSTFMD